MTVRLSVTIATLFVLAALTGVAQADDKPADAVRRAMASTDVAEAMTILNDAVGRFPKDARLLAARAQIRLIQKQKDLDGSLRDADAAVHLDPAVADGWTARGMVRMEQGDWGAAVTDFDRAIGINAAPLVLKFRGTCLVNLGRPADAVRDYDRALEASPDDADILQRRAEAFRALREFEKAMADATRAIRLLPDNPNGRQLRGTIFLELGQPRQAVAEYSLAIEQAPREANHWQLRSHAYYRSGQLEYALRDARRAVELNPDHGGGWFFRGQAQAGLGRLKEARADYDEALRRAPTGSAIWNARAEVVGQLGDWAGATADSRRATELDPKNADYWNRYAIHWFRGGNAAEANAAAARAVELEPDRGNYRANLAAIRAERGDVAAAMSDYDAAVRASDTGPVELSRAVLLAAHAGKSARAREIARQAATRFRDATDIETRLAVAYALAMAGGNADECRQMLNLMTKSKPDKDAAPRVELAVGQLFGCCGDWAAARPRLEKALQIGQPDEQCRAQLLLATTLAHVGESGAARTGLAGARKRIAALAAPTPAEAGRTPAGAQLTWPDRLSRELLLRDAEAAVAGR